MYKPIVSIITPFYNSEEFFRETIESVISQTFTLWEMICVDDGSQDKSAKIVEEYCGKDSRIRMIKRDDLIKGPSHCRNIGVAHAIGEYCMFLDSDDLLGDTCLENRVKAINDTDYKFVVFPMASFTDNVKDNKIVSHLDAHHYDYYFSSSVSAWPITSTLIRLDFIKELNGFDETLIRLEDVEFHLRAVLFSQGKYLVMKGQKPDCFYRITSIQNRFILEKFESSQQPLNDYINRVILYTDHLTNKKLLSKALLTILLNVLYVHAIIQMKNGKVQAIAINDAFELLDKKDKKKFRIISQIPSLKIRLITAALMRKFLLRKL